MRICAFVNVNRRSSGSFGRIEIRSSSEESQFNIFSAKSRLPLNRSILLATQPELPTTTNRPWLPVTVPAAAIVFAWHPVPGALRYTVEVSAAEGELLFSAESADTLLTVQLANVRPGRHQWWVRAHMEDGSERRSAASELEVR